MNDPQVKIRMYRTGLGDCHLISFAFPDGSSRHVLIDCGYFPGSPFPDARIEDIAADIEKRTGGSLSALVVTHEHQDHLQGFMDEAEAFRRMSRQAELWMAWTEKPGQKIVLEKRSLAGLEAAASGLALSDDSEARELAGLIEGLLGFSKGTDQAFETVKSWFPQGSRKYWNAGDIIRPAWLPGVRIYVLGPPKDLSRLRKTVGREGVEMYELAAARVGFSAAAMQEEPPGVLSPFDGKYARAELPPMLAESYEAGENSWRKIDGEWLATAARMALQLDSYTNNTSLVLAFELVGSGRVLLFVGDAQIGNWLSWQDLEFSVGSKKVSAAGLLSRTVFYKVGHHGSHNATLVKGGLLAMENSQLRAAIPTNEKWAADSKGWEMPNSTLLKELRKRCIAPILRPDQAKPNSLAVELTL